MRQKDRISKADMVLFSSLYDSISFSKQLFFNRLWFWLAYGVAWRIKPLLSWRPKCFHSGKSILWAVIHAISLNSHSILSIFHMKLNKQKYGPLNQVISHRINIPIFELMKKYTNDYEQINFWQTLSKEILMLIYLACKYSTSRLYLHLVLTEINL